MKIRARKADKVSQSVSPSVSQSDNQGEGLREEERKGMEEREGVTFG